MGVTAGGPPLAEREVTGPKYFQRLVPLLGRLHEVGCARDTAGNRRLHYDQYCLLILLALFNPALRPLRASQQASTLKKVQRPLGCPRTSLGALSEAVAVSDPTRLEGIIGELLGELPRRPAGGREHLRQVVTAVDGSIARTPASLAAAAYLKDKNGQTHCGWRFHTHFEIGRGAPARMDVTTAAGAGQAGQRQQLRRHLEADRCYVLDRGFAEFRLWNDIAAAGSSYVCRIRDNSDLSAVHEERPLSPAARQAGVVRDLRVTLGAGSKPAAQPDHAIRVVPVQTTPHKKTGGRKGGAAGPASGGIPRIATNLLDVPAGVVADLYRHRWLIELFFRLFKHLLGCRHLLSQDPAGIPIQAYCAVIACLLIQLWTGGRPTPRTFEMVCLYLQGRADLDEVTAHVEKLRAEKKAE
jgi:DDE family transposase